VLEEEEEEKFGYYVDGFTAVNIDSNLTHKDEYLEKQNASTLDEK
jgi:hypothetical protein